MGKKFRGDGFARGREEQRKVHDKDLPIFFLFFVAMDSKTPTFLLSIRKRKKNCEIHPALIKLCRSFPYHDTLLIMQYSQFPARELSLLKTRAIGRYYLPEPTASAQLEKNRTEWLKQSKKEKLVKRVGETAAQTLDSSNVVNVALNSRVKVSQAFPFGDVDEKREDKACCSKGK